MNIVATIEARMTSSRLPGKVLMEALGKPMLAYQVERLTAVPSINAIVLATTSNAVDHALDAFAAQNDILCWRGSEDDVMQRVIDAASFAKADVVVEITGDCPLIDPEIVEQVIQTFLSNTAEYVNNVQVRSYPDGMDTQVFRLEVLQRSASMTNDHLDREHVTLHIRNNPGQFSHLNLVAPTSLHWPDLGLTLDEKADYKLLKSIIEKLYPVDPLFSCQDIIKLLRENPEMVELNKDVKRKGDS